MKEAETRLRQWKTSILSKRLIGLPTGHLSQWGPEHGVVLVLIRFEKHLIVVLISCFVLMVLIRNDHLNTSTTPSL